jgi:hypothetical protein
MSAYCDDDITATEPYSQYAASATPAQLVDLLFAHCHPEQILGVRKLLRECFDPASADPIGRHVERRVGAGQNNAARTGPRGARPR